MNRQLDTGAARSKGMDVRAITVEVSKLSPKPGDILAIRCDRKLTMEQMAYMREVLEVIAPEGVKVAVLDVGCALSIVEPPNAEIIGERSESE